MRMKPSEMGPLRPTQTRRGLQAAGLLLLLAGGLVGAAGCRLITAPILMWGKEPTKEVVAEYPYLSGKKVALLVWAEPYTLFEFPNLQLEISEHVRVALKTYVPEITVVPNRPIVEYQTQNPNWDRENPALIGDRFGAERVLLIELTHFTTRPPDAPHLYRGHAAANVKVYDTSEPDALPAYQTPLDVQYPPDSHGSYDTDQRDIRRTTMQRFAAELAKKFYDREEKL